MSNSLRPPSFPLKFFRWFCNPDYVEDIEGDLLERFEKRKIEGKSAGGLFALDVLKLFRSGIIRSFEGTIKLNNYGMLKNFLKSGWRNFVKYKTNSLINTFGLSIGICSTILLYLIVDYERSFDQFHEDAKAIYRVADSYPDGNLSDMIVTPLIPSLLEEYPEIKSGTRLLSWEDFFIYEDQALTISLNIVDSGFISVFTFGSVSGNLNEALSEPGNIALTSTTAKKLFGDKNPIGETIRAKDLDQDMIVSAIIADPPKNSTLQFEALTSWPASPSLLDVDQMGNWYNTFMTGYVKLANNATVSALEEKTPAFTDKYYLPKRKDNWVTFLPFVEEHSRLSSNDKTTGILAIISIAILIISCVNFINLTISQSLARSKEIGIRKVMGSFKSQIVFQFLIEGLVTMTSALFIALFLVSLIGPFVNSYYDLSIELSMLKNAYSILLIVGICLVVGILASLIMSVLLSGTDAIKSLKENIRWSGTGQWLQKSLIVFQFTVSLIFLAGTLIIWQQIHFMKSFDLRFDGSNVIAVNAYSDAFEDPKEAVKKLQLLRNELPLETAIEGVALSQNVPGKYNDNYNMFRSSDSIQTEGVHLKQLTVGHSYFDVLGIEILDGRNFSNQIASDTAHVIINRSAMEKLGWTDLENKFLLSGGRNDKFQVIGAVDDYHYRSLRESVEPLIHFYYPSVTNQLLVKLNPQRISEGLAIVEKSWASLDPYESFNFSFIDQEFDALYQSYEKLGTTVSIFSSIAILIALLGLFSIVSHVIKNREKEIGIRKVLGARLLQIAVLLSKNFVILVVIALFFAIPIIYYLSEKFLEDFVYRIPFSPLLILISGLTVLSLALFIVNWQSIKAAMANPVKSLRNE